MSSALRQIVSQTRHLHKYNINVLSTCVTSYQVNKGCSINNNSNNVITGVKSTLLNQSRFLSEDTETKSVTIWQDLKQIKSSPKPALILGFSGLIPFISTPLYFITSQTFCADIAFAQMAYGATILSFLGGVRWGFVIQKDHLRNWFNMGYSVAPSLIAWVGLLLPFPAAMLTMITGLAATAYFDTMLRGYPSWFKGLRFTLSFFAVLSLWTTFVCRYVLKGKNRDSLQEKSP
ncbi:hypothetical protein SNE40_018417 [Patella caerulea]|uniref:Transmembrane protein 69 n=1 Tax=Patella caerulea TaxID=87958 RepID=A0AAN8JAF7_PATCE